MNKPSLFPKMLNYSLNITSHLYSIVSSHSIPANWSLNSSIIAATQITETDFNLFVVSSISPVNKRILVKWLFFTCLWFVFSNENQKSVCPFVQSAHAQCERLPGYSNVRDGLIVCITPCLFFFEGSFVYWLSAVYFDIQSNIQNKRGYVNYSRTWLCVIASAP